MEAKTKGNDEYNHDHKEPGHGLEDVIEHDDEDAKGRQLAEVGEQVEPGTGDDEGTHWPAPALNMEEGGEEIGEVEEEIEECEDEVLECQ